MGGNVGTQNQAKGLVEDSIGPRIRDGEKGGSGNGQEDRHGVVDTSAKGTDIGLEKFRLGGKVAGAAPGTCSQDC